MPQDAMITLTGYLGRDRQIRETQQRTVVRRQPPTRLEFHLGDFKRYEDVLFESAWHEETIASREYAGLALPTYPVRRTADETIWHRVIVWNRVRCWTELAQGRAGRDHRAQELPYSRWTERFSGSNWSTSKPSRPIIVRGSVAPGTGRSFGTALVVLLRARYCRELVLSGHASWSREGPPSAATIKSHRNETLPGESNRTLAST